MILEKKPILPNGFQKYLEVSIKKEISILGTSRGYASKTLGTKLAKLKITDSSLVTRTELVDILHMLA